MPYEVIKRVEQLGRNDNQPELIVSTDWQGEELPDDLLEEEDTADENLSYGSEFKDPTDETAGVNEDSSIDSETKSYNDIPLLEDIIKVRKDLNPMTPT